MKSLAGKSLIAAPPLDKVPFGTLLFGPYGNAPRRVLLPCALRGSAYVREIVNKGGRYNIPITDDGIIIYPELLRALQMETGAAVANAWGFSRGFVSQVRKKLGINKRTQAFRIVASSIRARPWTEDQLALVQTSSDNDLAALRGVTRRSLINERSKKKIHRGVLCSCVHCGAEWRTLTQSMPKRCARCRRQNWSRAPQASR